jgi:trimethylamine--corrinoid protein Co-methyltransferase
MRGTSRANRARPDAQAAYESANTLLPTCLGGVKLVLPAAGWLEGGLAMGDAKFVMDGDEAGMMHTLPVGRAGNPPAFSVARETL